MTNTKTVYILDNFLPYWFNTRQAVKHFMDEIEKTFNWRKRKKSYFFSYVNDNRKFPLEKSKLKELVKLCKLRKNKEAFYNYISEIKTRENIK